jgi:hypothetical protein
MRDVPLGEFGSLQLVRARLQPCRKRVKTGRL